jgi:hypothetical protein
MLGVFLATTILAAAEVANPAAPPAPPAHAAPAKVGLKDPNALVCHSETSTGSRLTTKVCMTAQQAELRRIQDRETLRQAQGRLAAPGGDGMMGGPMGMPR